MPKAELDPDQVVAEREVAFEPLEDHGPARTVRFRIGRPTRNQTDWHCPYEVGGFDQIRAGAAHGADSVQALLLALAKVRVVLGALALEHGGRLEFAGRHGAGLPSLIEEAAGDEDDPRA